MRQLVSTILCIMFLAAASQAVAQAPKTLSYQATLSDVGGPLNGSYNLTFRIYSQASGGSHLWIETLVNVPISNGNVSVTLGNIVPIDIQTTTPLWLGIAIDGPQEISPRVELSGSLYALGLALPYSANTSSSTSTFAITNSGFGQAATFSNSNVASPNEALRVSSAGAGSGLHVHQTGTGPGASITNANSNNMQEGLVVINDGKGWGVGIRQNNASATNPALNINNFSSQSGIKVNQLGSGGHALHLDVLTGSYPALNITHAGGGTAINANKAIVAPEFHGAFIGDGSQLTGISVGLSLPFSQSTTSGGNAFAIDNQATTGSAAWFRNASADNNGYALSVINLGTYGTALNAYSEGGPAAQINLANPGGSETALRAMNEGLGSVAHLFQLNALSTASALTIEHYGTGNAITANRPIQATQFIGDGSLLTNLPSSGLALPFSQSSGAGGNLFSLTNTATSGAAGVFTNSNAGNNGIALLVDNQGELGGGLRANSVGGPAGVFVSTNPSSSYEAFQAVHQGLGTAAVFYQLNSSSTAPAVSINHFGTGNAITANRPIQATSFIGSGSQLTGVSAASLQLPFFGSSDSETAFSIDNFGMGNAANFSISNPASNARAISAAHLGSGPTLDVIAQGDGVGAFFTTSNELSGVATVIIQQMGSGSALELNTYSTSTGAPALSVSNSGTGNAIFANGPIQATSFVGDGSQLTGISGFTLPYSSVFDHSGGSLLNLENSNSNGNAATFSSSAVAVATVNIGSSGAAGLEVNNSGESGTAGIFRISNSGNTSHALNVYNEGATGSSAFFHSQNPGNPAPVIQIANEGTGAAIIANRPIEATYFVGDGSLLTNLPALSLPYTTTAESASTLFSVVNNGYGSAGSFTTNAPGGGSSPALTVTATGNTSYGFEATNSGLGSAGRFMVTNASSGSASFVAYTAGTGDAGYFNSSNTGSSASAVVAVSDGSGATVRAETMGTGSAGYFRTYSTSNTEATLRAITSGAGPALSTTIMGTGGGAAFQNYNETNGSVMVSATTNGLGSAGQFQITNSSSGAHVLNLYNAGSGLAIYANSPIQASAFIGDGSQLTNLPSSLTLPFQSGGSDNATLFAITSYGDGAPAYFAVNNPANAGNALFATTNGTGPAASFYADNTANSSPIVSTSGGGSGASLFAYSFGSGRAGDFQVSSSTNSQMALNVTTVGTGSAGYFYSSNTDALDPAVRVEGYATNAAAGQFINSAGSGTAAYAGHFRIASSTNNSAALFAETYGTSRAAEVAVMDAGNNSEALSVVTFGTGPAILARAEGGGPAIQVTGGLKYNVTEVTSGNIFPGSAVYNITGGGPLINILFGSEGDTFIAHNGTGSGIAIEGVSLSTNETKQMVYVAGAWRGL
jgi:hypothetical protein